MQLKSTDPFAVGDIPIAMLVGGFALNTDTGTVYAAVSQPPKTYRRQVKFASGAITNRAVIAVFEPCITILALLIGLGIANVTIGYWHSTFPSIKCAEIITPELPPSRDKQFSHAGRR
jgi:hypothetical protein